MTEEIWQKYFRTRDIDLRDSLILEYLPLVKQIAGRLAIGLPSHIEEDELIACGIVGLLEALERYNPSSEASFKTFATWRIRGAMLDELRKITWMPRSMYQRLRQLQDAGQRLGHRLGREPEAAEIAKELGWSPEAVEQVYAQMNYFSLLSLDSLLFAPAADYESAEEPFLAKGSFPTPEENLEKEEQQEILAGAVEKLSEREKLVLSLYYKEELTLREIGEVLKVTAARVSQIHARCILKLREEMQKAGYLEDRGAL